MTYEFEHEPPGQTLASLHRLPLFRIMALSQGIFYLITGIWPLISIRTFQKVTGPKVDLWLVKTVGLLITVVGAVLTTAGVRRRAEPEVPLLAVGSALALTIIDVIYVSKKRISAIYLLDAAAELALTLGWAVVWRLRKRS